MERADCTTCGVGFPLEDLIDVEGAPRCPRCFALTSSGHRGGVRNTDGAGRETQPADHDFTPESLEAMAAADPGDGLTAADGAGRGSAPTDEPASGEVEQAVGGFGRLAASVREWAAGRNGWIRAPVLLWMGWILVHYWSAPWYSTVFSGIDLAIHEIGHILWAPFGELLASAGGTLTQVLAPAVAGVVFARQRDWFAVSFAACWLGINCFEIVEYAGDAMARQLPLVSPTTGSPQHDWAYMLSRLGILRHTDTVAAAWQWAGRIAMTAGIAFGAWILWLMQRPETGGQRSESGG
ncbi:MAG: hypothetical protein ACN0LA_12930 [Candidatus Longimicrobiales bacterium M2_2A_002]